MTMFEVYIFFSLVWQWTFSWNLKMRETDHVLCMHKCVLASMLSILYLYTLTIMYPSAVVAVGGGGLLQRSVQDTQFIASFFT